MEHKYIVLDIPSVGETAIVLPGYIRHVDVAEAMIAKFPGIKVVSGGFFKIAVNGPLILPVPFGESKSLNTKSRGVKDGRLLQSCLGLDPESISEV